MKLQISPRVSDICITIYAILTLYYRIQYESTIGASVVQSLVNGLCLVAMPWSLIKLKILNPAWFGLFKSKS